MARYFVILLLIAACLFDKHFQILFGLNKFLLGEFILVGLTLALFALVVYRRKIAQTNALIYLLLFILMLYGAFISNIFVSIVGGVFLFKTLLAYSAGYFIYSQEVNLRKVLFFPLMIGYATLLVSVLQFSGIFETNPFGIVHPNNFGDINGIFSTKNKNAQLIVFTFVVQLIIFRPKKKIVRLIFGVLSFLVVLMTMSRQGMIMFLVAIFLMNLTYFKNYKLYLTTVSGVIGIITVFVIYPEIFFGLVPEAQNILAGDYFRLITFEKSLEVIKDYPIFGLGPGTFGGAVAHTFYPKFNELYGLFNFWINSSIAPTTTDVFWSHFIAEAGLVGTLFMIIILKRIYDKIDIPIDYCKAFKILLIATIIFSFFSMNMEAIFTSVIVFFFIGMIIKKYSR
ncbi:O-antigen ligase family protein [Fodinibius halophilus]|uniref:O-antigen ligase-related domain-containing protein n=1 Tax=Fodinibius halophilus TaxID=1736908 RepID=A0A6M1SWS7_9BACT|nr:O-antigen ligase family protein [Fodinibius halophilus]NGP88318.1 hypothetical protein [Fodinibius halophilus]